MAEALAQRTNVVRVKRFLSARGCSRLRAAIAELRLQPYAHDPDADWLPDGTAVHVTRYLNTHDLFGSRFPKLRRRLMLLAASVASRQRWFAGGCRLASRRGRHRRGAVALEVLRSLRVRCAEHHSYAPGGSLPQLDHSDLGSVLTVDVLLRGAPRGGEFQTVERGGRRLRRHEFRAGDALVFVAHKFHRVSPVRRGRRETLVVELWRGEERLCGHRCEHQWGRCDFQVPA